MKKRTETHYIFDADKGAEIAGKMVGIEQRLILVAQQVGDLYRIEQSLQMLRELRSALSDSIHVTEINEESGTITAVIKKANEVITEEDIVLQWMTEHHKPITVAVFEQVKEWMSQNPIRFSHESSDEGDAILCLMSESCHALAIRPHYANSQLVSTSAPLKNTGRNGRRFLSFVVACLDNKIGGMMVYSIVTNKWES